MEEFLRVGGMRKETKACCGHECVQKDMRSMKKGKGVPVEFAAAQKRV